MYAIEFQTKVRNGRIEIPEQYQNRLQGQVRVIVLSDDAPSMADMIDQLLASPLKLENFTLLTREEIYEKPGKESWHLKE